MTTREEIGFKTNIDQIGTPHLSTEQYSGLYELVSFIISPYIYTYIWSKTKKKIEKDSYGDVEQNFFLFWVNVEQIDQRSETKQPQHLSLHLQIPLLLIQTYMIAYSNTYWTSIWSVLKSFTNNFWFWSICYSLFDLETIQN